LIEQIELRHAELQWYGYVIQLSLFHYSVHILMTLHAAHEGSYVLCPAGRNQYMYPNDN